MKILVTGATGELGAAVIEQLLQKTGASQIAALVRDENKATDLKAKGVDIRLGSYDDLPSLDRAVQGIDKVLLIAGTDEEKRLQQHQNVIDAARRAGVGCIAYTSRTLQDPAALVNKLMLGHFQTEDYLTASGANYIIFRNVLYLDTIPQFAGPTALDTGIHLPTGEGCVPFALRSDMGEAIANTLLESGCANKIYYFTGSENYSFGDVAAALSELSGKPVSYTAVERTAYEAQLKQKGLPDVMVQRIIGFLTDIKNGQEGEVSPDLENQLGRKPASLKEGLRLLYKL